jgi:hypothetical protein
VRFAGTPVELWHQDEARVGQQGTLAYVWGDKGSRPPALKDLRYEWARLAEGSTGLLRPVEWPDEGYLFGQYALSGALAPPW